MEPFDQDKFAEKYKTLKDALGAMHQGGKVDYRWYELPLYPLIEFYALILWCFVLILNALHREGQKTYRVLIWEAPGDYILWLKVNILRYTYVIVWGIYYVLLVPAPKSWVMKEYRTKEGE